MAYIKNTAFEARITNGEFDDLSNITGKFQADSADADVSAGILCVKAAQLPCEGFTGVYNENAWIMNAASASTDMNTPVYAANTYDSAYATGKNGLLYHVGTETLGLGIPAGQYGTFRRIVFDGNHFYRFGVGNLSADLGDNEYLTVGADGKLVPADSAPITNGAIYFQVTGSGTFTEGTTVSFGYVDAVACAVFA